MSFFSKKRCQQKGGVFSRLFGRSEAEWRKARPAEQVIQGFLTGFYGISFKTDSGRQRPNFLHPRTQHSIESELGQNRALCYSVFMAEIQIFGTKKCKDTQKAERFLKERGLAFHFVDLTQKTPSAGELKSMAQCCGGAENLIDRESQAFKKAQLEYMDFDALEEISENPLLLKTPVIRQGGKAILGFDPKALKDFLA